MERTNTECQGMGDGLSRHMLALSSGIKSGRIVPLLGAGVHFLSRQGDQGWEPGASVLPGGHELSQYLMRKFDYPDEYDSYLPRLTQYVAVVAGRGTLYDELHRIFDADYPVTDAHRLVARLPSLVEGDNRQERQLVITTNYDDTMESAFRDAGEAFDVVSYIADGVDRGKFMHRHHSGELQVIDRVKEYRGLDLEKRSVVLKLHGSVDRFDRERDSYVIAEDDYIEYLMRADVTTLLPTEIVERLYRSQFLFMGYGLRDLNLQVVLHRLWGEQKIPRRSAAIQLEPSPVDVTLWDRRNVEIVDARLGDYLLQLERVLEADQV